MFIVFPAAFCPFHLHSPGLLLSAFVWDGKANVRSSLQQIAVVAHEVIGPLTQYSCLTHVEMCFHFITAGTRSHSDDELAWSQQMEQCPSLKELRKSSDVAGSCCLPSGDGCFCRLSPCISPRFECSPGF